MGDEMNAPYYGVNEPIIPQFNTRLKREQLLDFMPQQEPTMVVMEACYSSHYWGRERAKLGQRAIK
jgi:RecB family endonuclease NucS